MGKRDGGFQQFDLDQTVIFFGLTQYPDDNCLNGVEVLSRPAWRADHRRVERLQLCDHELVLDKRARRNCQSVGDTEM